MHDSMTSPLVALRNRRLCTSGCLQPTAGSGFLHFRKCFQNVGKGIVDMPPPTDRSPGTRARELPGFQGT
ncbi:hypothetical protein DPMN_002811 [Dreissena polymorpha]|uniref:Uncharacterized protein n=1 Tax=Dreissena polymorpha TaxID=45954 RepID=A0A9D4RU67_DREPO|nr:hypothetical protein DPMN_002811 [Dreissena polymorpha]